LARHEKIFEIRRGENQLSPCPLTRYKVVAVGRLSLVVQLLKVSQFLLRLCVKRWSRGESTARNWRAVRSHNAIVPSGLVLKSASGVDALVMPKR